MSMIECPHCGQMFERPKGRRRGGRQGAPRNAQWDEIFATPGRTVWEAARMNGAHYQNALHAGRRRGYEFAPDPMQSRLRRNLEQEAHIARRLAEGATLTEVGAELGITRERVRQIANRIGAIACTSHGAARERNAARNAARTEDRARKAADRKRIEDALREKVGEGKSIRQAAREIGLTKGELQTVSKRIGLGAITKHGRWRGRYRKEDDGRHGHDVGP